MGYSAFKGLLAGVFMAFFAVVANAEEIKIQGKNKYQNGFSLAAPSAFVIETPSGDIEVREGKGTQVEVFANNRGTKEATLIIEEPRPGQFKIKVKMEESSISGGGVNISGISIVRGSIISGGNVQISNFSSGSGRVIINGVDMSGEFGGQGPVDLVVAIPPELFAHLKAKSEQGDVTLNGKFAGSLQNDRQVNLSSSQGTISCSDLCALNNITLKTSQGEIEISSTEGVVEAKTSQGNVTANDATGDLDLKTDQGNVTANRNTGNIRAKSSQGNIRIVGQSGGAVRARTSMGNINLDNPDATDEDAKSDMGSVRGLRPRSGGDCDLGKKPRKNPFSF